MSREEVSSIDPRRNGAMADAGGSELGIVTVPIASVLPGESPRLGGEDQEHVARLAESEAALPPILVDRKSMRVIDGMHRLMAASIRGEKTIRVRFFEGNEADAFLRAVEENVTHGLPLSHADRRAAAARIVASHPQMSDRAIARSAGLAAGTVASIRRYSTDGPPPLEARVGRDGKVRPLNGVDGRRRAAEVLIEHPEASLREVARKVGVSPATVRDVRKRLERGEEPTPEQSPRPIGSDEGSPGSMVPRPRDGRRPMHPAPAIMLEKLLRDPSLRHNELGRWLLRLLQHNVIAAGEWSKVMTVIPPHCGALVAELARLNAQMWSDVARDLDERAGNSRVCLVATD